jgi:predicted PurR-regulated permease PerM
MQTDKIFNERTKAIGFLLVLGALTCVIVYQLRFFSSSVLGAFTLYILLRKPYKILLVKGWNKFIATVSVVIFSFLIIFIIGGGITGVIYAKIIQFNPQTILEGIRLLHDAVIEQFGYSIFPENFVEQGVQWLGRALPGLLSATGNVIANVVLMIFVLYFMLEGSETFEKSIDKFLPISKNNIRLLKRETGSMVICNAIGVPLIMVLQGSFAALGYWFTNAGDPIIWGLLTGFSGLIPAIGTGIVWVPLSLNLIIGGSIWQGVVLLVWGACVVSLVDNVFRMMFLKRYANIHPLIPLFGVILGINLFGFWGVIFGPLVISGFLLLIKIYSSEFLPNGSAD